MNNKYVTQQQTTTPELQAHDLGYANKECGGVKHVSERRPPPPLLPLLTWDSGVTVQHKTTYKTLKKALPIR